MILIDGGILKWGTPESSILIEISIVNNPFWGTTISGNPHMFNGFFMTSIDPPAWAALSFLGEQGRPHDQVTCCFFWDCSVV